MNQPVAVLGATGGQGGAVVDALLTGGVPVRAVVRSADSSRARALAARGVDVVTGDLEDADSLVRAFDGARAVFAVTTPFEDGVDAEVRQGRAIVDAAVRARVPHLVFSSVAGADGDSGVPHFESKSRIEAMIRDTDLAWTIVAPTYFFDNILGDTDSLLEGELPLPLEPDQRLRQLARPDLGEFVAYVVAHPEPHLGRRIELASDEPTLRQMAEDVGRTLGRPVRPVTVPMSEVYAGSRDMGAMWDFLRGDGYQVDVQALRSSYPSVHWTDFASWFDTAVTRA